MGKLRALQIDHPKKEKRGQIYRNRPEFARLDPLLQNLTKKSRICVPLGTDGILVVIREVQEFL